MADCLEKNKARFYREPATDDALLRQRFRRLMLWELVKIDENSGLFALLKHVYRGKIRRNEETL